MVRWLGILIGTLRSAVRTHRELALQNLALRQQLAVWKARQPRPRLTAMHRIFWVVVSRLWKSWRNSLQVVRPETVVGWHRQGFRRYWAWKSRCRRGRPAIEREIRDLIQDGSAVLDLKMSFVGVNELEDVCHTRSNQLAACGAGMLSVGPGDMNRLSPLQITDRRSGQVHTK